ncbi:MAG TPA: BTAD domain-containing putative transcriptional regulator, partial [Rhodopila sp.]|nr:BTAD domain-containing putative transcriptional regulator [Rhodopila sp.]
MLAMASPKPVLRLQLASLLWSRRQNEQARASLRQSIHELQDSLGPDWQPVFIADRHHLSLRAPELDIDAHTLAQPPEISSDLLDRYEAPLLEDLNGLDPAFDRWLEDERARFARIARAVGESILAQSDDPVACIRTAERLVEIDRRHEAAWRSLIRGHAEQGDIGLALAAYDRLRGVLAEIPDARPSAETEELISRIRMRPGPPTPSRPAAPAAELPPVTPRDRSSLRVRLAPFRALGDAPNDAF